LPTPTGDTAVVKADTARTNGSLTVIELVVAPKHGPGLHIHRREDELWYVIDGEFRFKAGDEILWASPGGMAFGPRGTPHCFQNIGDETGRLLVITTPSGLERFFEEFAQLTRDGAMDHLAPVAHRSWIDFVGPPVAESDPI
jgi:mannose-6-phosphate isomerase-like protein (cupin superfamily)